MAIRPQSIPWVTGQSTPLSRRSSQPWLGSPIFSTTGSNTTPCSVMIYSQYIQSMISSQSSLAPSLQHFFSSPGYSTPPEYRDWEWRWHDLLDANPDAHIAWHSDHPPMGFPIDPIKQLFGFVTRKDILEDGSVVNPTDWAADDVLTVKKRFRS